VFQIARNKEPVLKYGWYAVKNRSSSEAKHDLSLKDAKGKESDLFSGKPWNPAISGLEKERLGIDALRTGLSKAICDHIDQQVRDQLKSKKTELQALESKVLQDHRNYLRSIVDEYTIRKDECLNDEDVKQDLQWEEWQKSLSDDLHFRGATRKFQDVTTNIDIGSDLAAVRRCSGELADEENMYTWINERYQSTNNGCIIPGLVSQTLIEELFREQTAPWEMITTSFTSAMSQAAQTTVKEYLEFIHKKEFLGSQKFESLVLKALDAQMEGFRKACLNELNNRRSLFGCVTDEPEFAKEVRRARAKRFMAAIARMHDYAESPCLGICEPCPDKFDGCPKSIIPFDLTRINIFLTDDRQTVYQIHDILKAHYSRALSAYIDWIRKEFLNQKAVRKTLGVCSNALVDAMSDEEVKGLFGPDPETKKAKKNIGDAMGQLETVLKELEAISTERIEPVTLGWEIESVKFVSDPLLAVPVDRRQLSTSHSKTILVEP
jgi:hypothetical protein